MRIIPEQQVLIAAINLAVFDACKQPIYLGDLRTKSDDPRDYKLPVNVRSAMYFLHRDGLDTYCNWLDFDPSWLRKRLQQFMYEENLLANPIHLDGMRIDASKRRHYRLNYRIFMLSPDEPFPNEPDQY
jgi:hypothetical protein